MTENVLARTANDGDLRDWTDPCIEPTLAEILSDPMMDLVFRRDQTRRDSVEKLLRAQASRLAATGAFAVPCRCA